MFDDNMSQFIRSVRINIPEKQKNDYPFSLEAIREISLLKLNAKVSYIIGENGTGKSTLLEAIAVAYGFNAEGGSKNFNFETNRTDSILSKYITLIKGIKRPKDGFFLRAESFYNLASNIDELDKGLGGPKLIDSYGRVSLHKQSHGESFIALAINRFGGNGLYILDEPEAALSPTRQMSLLSRMHQLVEDGSQFIIATHSPILMAYPGASIYSIEMCKEIDLEETEHFRVTKDFLNNRERMLDILFEK